LNIEQLVAVAALVPDGWSLTATCDSVTLTWSS
jgi:hypothetical protein